MDIGPGITIGPGIQYYVYVAPPGQVAFTTVGTTTWTVPDGVTSISAVCVGGGGKTSDSSTASATSGGQGAVRIIWGEGRAYPATNTGNV